MRCLGLGVGVGGEEGAAVSEEGCEGFRGGIAT